MKTFKQYFEYEKDIMSPHESDFLAILDKIETKRVSSPQFIPARVTFAQRMTLAFSVVAVFVLFINIDTPQNVAEKKSISEAVMIIDETNSFDEQ